MQHHVPKSEIDRLRRDSYEVTIGRVQEAISTAKDRLFPNTSEFRVLGTFFDRAVVETNSGFFDVQILRDGDNLLASAAEKIVVESYSSDDSIEFFQKTAGDIVESFLSGSREDAASKLKALIEVSDLPVPMSEADLSLLAVSKLQSPRPWKQALQEDGSIRKVAGSAATSGPSPKFDRIIAGKVPQSALPEYSTLIHQSLSEVFERLSTLSGLYEEAKTPSSSSPLAFMVEDAAIDIADVLGAVSVVRNKVRDLGLLAEVHDAAARELEKYELLARFLAKSAAIGGPRGPDGKVE